MHLKGGWPIPSGRDEKQVSDVREVGGLEAVGTNPPWVGYRPLTEQNLEVHEMQQHLHPAEYTPPGGFGAGTP